MVQEMKTVFIVFASMTNYSNWKRRIALATNGGYMTSSGLNSNNLSN